MCFWIVIPENCLTIWNSKLIHANTAMSKNKNGLNRLTCYVTYIPEEFQTLGNRQKRIQAYLNGEICSHWANSCHIKKYPWGFKKNYEKKKI
jgi:hypothetical protein